jgi:hypothetical protein
MRREVARKILWLALALVVGVAMDRFVLPIFEPLTHRWLTIFPEKGEQKCAYALIVEEHFLGKLRSAVGKPPTPGTVTMGSYEEGYYDLPCGVERNIGNVILDCRCPQ